MGAGRLAQTAYHYRYLNYAYPENVLPRASNKSENGIYVDTRETRPAFQSRVAWVERNEASELTIPVVLALKHIAER